MTQEATNTTWGIRQSLSLFDRRRRFSSSSALTVSTVHTALPQYTAIEGSETPEDELPLTSESTWDVSHASSASEPRASDYGSPSDMSSGTTIVPPRYSYTEGRHSVILSWAPPAEENIATELANGFRYSYPLKSNKTWATLHLHTRSVIPGNLSPPQGQPKVPQFWGCEPIAGVVDLDLENPQSINEINIIVKGKIATSSLQDTSLRFLTYEYTLWNRSYGDPRQLVQVGSTKKFNGKLLGKYSFPFSFPFPTEVRLLNTNPDSLPNTGDISPYSDTPPRHQTPSSHGISPFPHSPKSCSNSPSYSLTSEFKGKKEASFSHFTPSSETKSSSLPTNSPEKSPVFSRFLHRTESLDVENPVAPIPQTFFEKAVTASVIYEFNIHFVHGRFKPTTKIKTIISYIPALQPLPASQKRRKAYEAGMCVPGPFSDPDGWFPSPPATVHGTFNCHGMYRQTQIDCVLYVAQPLSYARGTIIPCFLTFSCNSAEILGLLSTPKFPSVRLMRRLRHPVSFDQDAYDDLQPMTSFDIFHPLLTPGKASLEQTKTLLDEMGRATWWVSDIPNELHTRCLEGEIHLSTDLKPSCPSEIFTVEYYVEMLSPRSQHFKPNSDHPLDSPQDHSASRQREAIATIPVEITTLCRSDEPVPIPVTRPTRALRPVLLDDVILEEE